MRGRRRARTGDRRRHAHRCPAVRLARAARVVADLAVGHARDDVEMTHRHDDDVVLDDEGRHGGRGRAAVGARRARRRRPGRAATFPEFGAHGKERGDDPPPAHAHRGPPERRRRSSRARRGASRVPRTSPASTRRRSTYEPGTRAGYHAGRGHERARRDRGARERRARTSGTCATRSSGRWAWTTAGSACRRTGTRPTASASGSCTSTASGDAGASARHRLRARRAPSRCPAPTAAAR